MLIRLILLALLSISTYAFSVSRQPLRRYFQWGDQPVRGVNLGGWLVLEPWITPSLFEDKPDWVIDEWSYGAYWRDRKDVYTEIRNHWNSWYRKSDLEEMKRVGLNTVRIPIGYWSLIPLSTSEPYLPGAFDFLKLGVNWAQQVGLNVMIDLHGAPGSQNGFDNSGFRGPREWFWNQTNADRSIDALKVLVREFTQPSYANTVTAIGLLNEPFPVSGDQVWFLKKFMEDSYRALRAIQTQEHLVLVLDAAYQGLPTWHDFMVDGYYDVGVDTHSYSMFNNYTLVLGYNQVLQWFCNQTDYFRASDKRHWTIIGEFTPAHTDCAKWLNGRGRGARWDNTLNGSYPLRFPGDCRKKTGSDPSKWDGDYIDHLAESFESQTYVYEQASGWIMWTWKNEEAADWSMVNGITYGWIPTPVYNKTRGRPCASTAMSISAATSLFSTWIALPVAIFGIVASLLVI